MSETTSLLFPYTTLFRSRPGAAGYHQGVAEGAVLGMEWNAPQVQHGQDVGVADLVLQAEADQVEVAQGDRKSTRLNSSHVETSYAVYCLKKKNSIANTFS